MIWSPIAHTSNASSAASPASSFDFAPSSASAVA